jgi:5'(3')-deoxyribonucleotidase
LCDVDGVLADFVASVLKFVNYEIPRVWSPFQHKHVTNWDIFAALKQEHLQDKFDAHASTPGFCQNLTVLPGARLFFDRLRMRGEVVVVTAPYESAKLWTHERLAWLKTHFEVPKKDVVFCKRKELVRGDVLIDDALHNAQDFPGPVLLIDRPWNRADKLPEHVTRCFGYDAAIDELDRLTMK